MMHSYTKCMAPDDSASGITNQVKVLIHVAHGRNMAVFGFGNAHAAASTVCKTLHRFAFGVHMPWRAYRVRRIPMWILSYRPSTFCQLWMSSSARWSDPTLKLQARP